MRAVMPRSRVARVLKKGNFYEVSSYSKAWPCLLPQHGPGRKHNREIVLTDWQWRSVRRTPELLLRGLIQSDGCRFTASKSSGAVRYSFTNRSAAIKEIFCRGCELVGVRWTVAGDKVYVSRKADVAHLDTFIGPKC